MFWFWEKKINKRDEFKEQRKMLIDHILESSKSFDKFLITLSSSLLWISFISIPRLIDSISIDFTIEYIYLLLIFWVLIFISIISVLFSYYFSTINSILWVEREDLKYKKRIIIKYKIR